MESNFKPTVNGNGGSRISCIDKNYESSVNLGLDV
jgi:hypothetical protein